MSTPREPLIPAEFVKELMTNSVILREEELGRMMRDQARAQRADRAAQRVFDAVVPRGSPNANYLADIAYDAAHKAWQAAYNAEPEADPPLEEWPQNPV